jgi:hypothetical protein
MRFPILFSIILFLTFILLLFVFYFFYGNDLIKFIGRLNNNLFKYSALICIFGFLILYLYILLKTNFTKEDNDKIFINIITILICTILWIISSYYNIKILNILFLFALCIVNLYLIFSIINLKEENYKILKNISIIFLYYLLFHHLVIDLLLWNYYN